MLWGGRRGNGNFVAACNRWSAAMPQPNDLSRSLVALDQNSTIIAVVEMSQSSWLVAGMLPGIERQPRQKLEPSAERLLGLLHRWRDEAVKAGRKITRIATMRVRSLTRHSRSRLGRLAQPNEGDPRPAGHSQFQTNPAQGGGASCNAAHAGGLGAATECLGRAAAQYGAPGRRRQPDQGDRGGSSETIGAGARDRTTRHGTAPGSGRRRRRRNG